MNGRMRFSGCFKPVMTVAVVFLCCGCLSRGRYSNSWVYPEDIRTVCVKMFESSGFRRDYEYSLTDAICKRIEAQTPYKIVSDEGRADTVLSGTIVLREGVLTGERYTGTPLEKEAVVSVVVTWKDTKTGRILIDKQEVDSYASYSGHLGQSPEYASSVAVGRAAQKVVELMETKW